MIEEFTDNSIELKEVDLDILVPTLNRPKATEFNQRWLISILEKLNPEFSIRILLSENGSDDGLQIDVSAFSQGPRVETVLIRRASRLPLGEHMEWLSSTSRAKYHLWCGDDDLMDPLYLKWIVDNWASIKEERYSIVVSDNQPFTEEDFFNAKSDADDKIVQSQKYSGLRKQAYRLIARGNQLSGILLAAEIENAVWHQQKLPGYNLYPWMGFISHALANGGSVFEVTNCPVMITSDTQKHFTYRKDGLFCEISEAVRIGLGKSYFQKYFSAALVMASFGGWRIFQTSPNVGVCLLNYLKLVFEKRVSTVVWILGLPFILKRFLSIVIRKAVR